MGRARNRPSRIALIALLPPWVAPIVIPVHFPESGLVVCGELNPANPLRALPEVEVWDEQPRRPAVLGVKRLPVVLECDPGLALCHIIEWHVGRVSTVRVGDDERRRLHAAL